MKDRLNEISKEVGQWAARNFKTHAPALGILEETGELCHCFLKRLQKIRGFDDPVKFLTEASDAIADAAVYNSHHLFLSCVPLDADPVCRPGVNMEELSQINRFFGRMGHDVSTMLNGVLNRAGRPIQLCIFDHLVTVSDAIEIDFMDNLEKTWARVSKRDWVASPANAHAIAEGAD